MFLKSKKKSEDDGAALIAVIGIAAVIMVFVGVTGSLVVGALHFSDTTRAGVQAQAAGQAGIAFVAADLTNGTCGALPYTHSSTPVYSVNVSYQRAASGTTWISGCPSTAPDVTKVKIVAVGTGSAFVPVTQTVESIFNYIPAVTPPGITTSGSAIYGYNELDGTITNLKITQQGSADKPGIQFKSGNAKCQTGGVIEGDVILGNGAYNSPSGCTINGDLWASQTVSIGNNSVITGSVHAAGTANPTVDVAGGAAVNGNIYSAGPVNVNGNVGGNIITGPTGGQSTISATVGGSIVSAGTVRVSGGSVAGGITQNKTGIVAPVAPTVPGWVDFKYTKTDWVDGNGVPFVEVKPTTCTTSAIAAAMTTAAETIVNTLTSPCGGGQVNLTGATLSLQADTVLVANSFELKNMTITSAAGLSGPQRRLWIITPDTTADAQPTCTGPESQSQIDNQVQFDKSVAVFVYTPCGLSNSGSEMWGQLYTSTITFNNAFTLNFVQMGLPGVDFDHGTYTPPPTPTPGKLSTLFSTRNISG